MQIRREGMEEVKSSLADVVSKPDRTFKELSGSEKVRFILDYYKWHILAGVVVLGVSVRRVVAGVVAVCGGWGCGGGGGRYLEGVIFFWAWGK